MPCSLEMDVDRDEEEAEVAENNAEDGIASADDVAFDATEDHTVVAGLTDNLGRVVVDNTWKLDAEDIDLGVAAGTSYVVVVDVVAQIALQGKTVAVRVDVVDDVDEGEMVAYVVEDEVG